MTRFFLALSALVLAACASVTPYQPAAQPGAYGFTERRIENNRYAITFSGNSLTERETVESYLLYRAAELTLQQGFDYFVVAQRATDGRSSLVPYGGSGHLGFRPDYYWYAPRYGWRSYYDPFWNDTTYREVTRYQATAEIALFKGQKPATDAQAFDARQVTQNLEGQIRRPAPPVG
jgi:hypothetical protein